MKLAGYKEWIEVFDENISKIWQSERKELQKVAMLYGALERELLNVRVQLRDEIKLLKGKLVERDVLIHKSFPDGSKQQTPNLKNKENQKPNSNYFTKSSIFEVASPDLFQNINNVSSTNTSSSVDLTLSDEDKTHIDGLTSPTQTSPTINNKYKRKFKKKNLHTKENNFKKDVFQKEFDHEMSVVEGTPEHDKTKNERSNVEVIKKRSQIFATKKRKVKPSDKNVQLDKVNSEETYYEENSDDEPMQLTDLLNYINEDNSENSDDVVKEDLQNNTQNKKPKVVTNVEVEPIVRGIARKQLTGFSCDKCKLFYSNMNLSPEELQKKMDECSKHRYKYKPPDETIPGFWDLTFDAP